MCMQRRARLRVSLPSHLQGADIVVLGSWDNLVPYVWVTREKLSDIRELRGKKVGVNRAGSKPWLIIQVLLQDAGLDPVKDLTLLQMGGGSQERVSALMRGGIDATLADVLLEPIMIPDAIRRIVFPSLSGMRRL